MLLSRITEELPEVALIRLALLRMMLTLLPISVPISTPTSLSTRSLLMMGSAMLTTQVQKVGNMCQIIWKNDFQSWPGSITKSSLFSPRRNCALWQQGCFFYKAAACACRYLLYIRSPSLPQWWNWDSKLWFRWSSTNGQTALEYCAFTSCYQWWNCRSTQAVLFQCMCHVLLGYSQNCFLIICSISCTGRWSHRSTRQARTQSTSQVSITTIFTVAGTFGTGWCRCSRFYSLRQPLEWFKPWLI